MFNLLKIAAAVVTVATIYKTLVFALVVAPIPTVAVCVVVAVVVVRKIR